MSRRLAALLLSLVALGSSSGCFDLARRQRVNQVYAIVALRGSSRALVTYREACGGFPESLVALQAWLSGEEAGCTVTADDPTSGVRWIHPDTMVVLQRLTRWNELHGYRFVYEALDPMAAPDGRRLYERYRMTADPLERGETGFASFWVGPEAKIHQNWDGPAGPSDPVVE